MLGQRRRQWPSIDLTLSERLVLGWSQSLTPACTRWFMHVPELFVDEQPCSCSTRMDPPPSRRVRQPGGSMWRLSDH